jgi:hypothetical protein
MEGPLASGDLVRVTGPEREPTASVLQDYPCQWFYELRPEARE